MEDQNTKNNVGEPFTEYGRYTYVDHLTWEREEMVELIKGKVFKFSDAPQVI